MFLAEEQSVPYPYFGQLISESLLKKTGKKRKKFPCRFLLRIQVYIHPRKVLAS